MINVNKLSRSEVYELHCNDCHCYYIGQTGRAFHALCLTLVTLKSLLIFEILSQSMLTLCAMPKAYPNLKVKMISLMLIFLIPLVEPNSYRNSNKDTPVALQTHNSLVRIRLNWYAISDRGRVAQSMEARFHAEDNVNLRELLWSRRDLKYMPLALSNWVFMAQVRWFIVAIDFNLCTTFLILFKCLLLPKTVFATIATGATR